LFHTINSKFYTIAVVLIFLFSLGYGILAFFLRDQNQKTILVQEAVTFEREIRTLYDMFYEVRFWETSVFFQQHPEAEKNFGAVIDQFRKRISKISNMELEISVAKKTGLIFKTLTGYEEDFNQIVQYMTDKRLNRTRMDTAYQSLASNVLGSNQTSVLKPLFNLTHFLTSYRIDKRESEYRALLLVVDYLESKLLHAQLIDNRMKGYVQNFKVLLIKDFELEQKIQSANERFDVVSRQLMSLMENLSKDAESTLRVKFLQISESRKELNGIFLISTIISIMILLLILSVISKKIIYPIRSMAGVMQEVENKNISSRFKYHGNYNDEIVQLGLSFNDMLDTIQANNEELLSYQNNLEKKIFELASSEKKLKNHREQLEITVQDRTSDLTVANTLLKSSLNEKDSLLKEIHHRVKNNLQIISSLLKIQANQTNNAQAAALFKDSQDRITSMALIHEQLYQSKDLSNIDFGIYIRKLVDSLMQSYSQNSRRIRTDIESNSIFLGIDVAIPCGLIINELVSNSLKYAFPAAEEGVISITTRFDNKNEIEMVIGDNGIGIPENLDFRNTKTFGLQLITGLVGHQLAGEIEINQNEGTEFRIRFKNLSGKERI
jgi:two-component sensor histidine kinase